MLKPYASHPERSRGRHFQEREETGRIENRSCFKRDKDRIIHSYYFRRLQSKTQVFVSGTDDFFRTRLTHSLETAQAAGSIAEALELNVDLAEAIALAHDLGHPPFGHAGERVLDEVMVGHGGFDHNNHTLKILAQLERRYAGFQGLNLTWETLEGVAKHNGPVKGEKVSRLRDIARGYDLELESHAGLEAQVAAISDDIAYNSHDFVDGLKAGLLEEGSLRKETILGQFYDEVDKLPGKIDPMVRHHEVHRRLFRRLLEDVIMNSRKKIEQAGVRDVTDVYSHGSQLVEFSSKVFDEIEAIRGFLRENLYQHSRVTSKEREIGNMVRRLFDHYLDDPKRLPNDWRDSGDSEDSDPHQIVCDYVAGMSDQFALDLHKKISDVQSIDGKD